MRLLTRRLVLRKVRRSDWRAYWDMSRHPEVPVNAGFPTPKIPSDTRKAVALMVREWGKPPFRRTEFSVLRKTDGAWVGGANLRWPHGGVAELGYSVHPRLWGNGYAPEAALRLIRWAFLYKGAHRVQATCWVKNKRSQRVMKKIGLRREGILRGYLKRDGTVRDEYIYGLTRADYLKSRHGH
ncbi:MAG: GNAT family protein [Pseudomonadota bacterium]